MIFTTPIVGLNGPNPLTNLWGMPYVDPGILATGAPVTLAAGRVHSLALEAKPMKEAQAWIDRYRKFWEANLDQFEKYLEKLQTEENKHGDDK